MPQDNPDAHFNPYAATDVPSESVPANADVSEYERLRRQYLNHEASVKSIGTLYLLGGLFGVLFCIGLVVWAAAGRGIGISEVLIGGVLLLISVGQITVALGLRNLAPWARIVAAVFAAIGLLGIPIGTLISIYFLYLLLSKKGEMVFSAHYKEVMVQPRTSNTRRPSSCGFSWP
ncbi:MAG: hypothetical protein AB8G99_25895 [Planctomycetaceae bacterium]